MLSYVSKVKKLLKSLYIPLRVSPKLFDKQPNTLAGPNRDYTKFILIGQPRSGSSLVIGSLRQHPQVVGFGELFNRGQIVFNIKGYDNASKVLYKAREEYPIDFLNRYIFSSYLKRTRAVGFKLFPEQLDNQHFECVWDWIEENRDVAIILLSRQNTLATYTSFLIAQKTQVWQAQKKSQRSSINVTVDMAACLAEFQTREQYEATVRAKIANHRVMEITYEGLSKDPSTGIIKIQEFLGLDRAEPEITQVKSETRPLSEIIENYRELKEQFANTRWNHYFNEE
ncbi:MAG: Stf0 family sulfotransferase [Cyanobacteria bacterium J06656_5]